MTAADVMLRDPKTLSGSATVDDVRAVLANPKVQMVLLADERRFRGAITAIPDSAMADEPALAYADPLPEIIAPTETEDAAFQRATDSPHRRVIVLGEDDQLLGLLCLNASRTNFCQAPT